MPDEVTVKSTNWKDTAELIGIAAIVASLVFVGLQMMQARDIAISDGNLANAANKIEENNAIVQNPGVWVRGTAGEELNREDAALFRRLVKNVVDSTFFEVVRMRRLGQDDIANGLVADFSAFLYENRGARRIWTDQQDSKEENRLFLNGQLVPGDAQFATQVRSYLAELDRWAN